MNNDYPSINSSSFSLKNGYVTYQRGENNPHWSIWKRIYERNIQEASGLNRFYKDKTEEEKFISAGENLIKIGKIEQAHECALLRSILDIEVNPKDVRFFIKNFNEILAGKKQFAAAVERLNAALSSKHQTKEYRGPSIAVFFNNYLITALHKNLKKLVDDDEKNECAFKDIQAFKNRVDVLLDQAFDQSIEDALEAMLKKSKPKKGKEQYDSGNNEWKELYKALQEMDNSGLGKIPAFKEMIKSKLHFDDLKTFIKNQAKLELTDVTSRSKTELHKQLNSIIDKKINGQGMNLKNARFGSIMGGAVQEFFDVGNFYIGAKEIEIDPLKGKVRFGGGFVNKNEIAKTDSTTIFFDRDMPQEKINNVLNNLQTEVNNTGYENLRETARGLRNFEQNNLSKLDENFIVYQSSKLYTLNDSFKGFHAGGKRTIADLCFLLRGLDFKNINDYLTVAYNTAEGAILHSERDEVTHNLEIAIVNALGPILFDDWYNFTGDITKNTNSQAIHILTLEGIKIPLSVFLIAAGNAMKEIQSKQRFAKAKVELVSKIKYPEPQERLDSNQETLRQIRDNWNNQRIEAKKESTFEVKFYMNFKEEIKKYI